MKEKLTQFSKGIFPYEKPTLLLSDKTINISVESGGKYDGNISITTEKKRKIKGIVSTDDCFMTIKTKTFYDTEIKIEYRFDAGYLSFGKTYSGSIQIICDCGEYNIPYSVKVIMPYLETSIGKVKDLFQFANLAKTNWIEAVKLFQKKKLKKILVSQSKEVQVLYNSFVRSVSANQGMEEFLVSIHKKIRTSIKVDKMVMEYTNIKDILTDSIRVTKDSWGYLEIQISSDTDFIELNHKMIVADNFNGDQFLLKYRINPLKCKNGVQKGNIFLKTPYQKIRIEILLNQMENGKENKNFINHRNDIAFIQNYLNFRMNRIDVSQYIQDMKMLVAHYYEAGHLNEYYLLNLHLAIAEGNQEEKENAYKKIESCKKTWDSDVYACAMEYLSAMDKKEFTAIEEANKNIEDMYKKTDGDWKIFWFLMNVDKKLIENEELKYEALYAILQKGIHSPVLYFEIAVLLNLKPSYVTELSGDIGRVVYWMCRENFMSEKMESHFIYLASMQKKYNYLIIRNLEKIYEKSKSTQVLQILISLLIKSQKCGKKYAKWYSLGVEKQIRVIRLYEFYLYSLDEDIHMIFPDVVLQYFSISLEIEEHKKAFYFANLVQNKEKYRNYYESYKAQILEFTHKELLRHVLNKNMAILYGELLKHGVLDEEEKKALPFVMFQRELVCRIKDFIGVVIVHEELEKEVFVPLEEGHAQIKIFTDHAYVFLVDKDYNRYYKTVDYTLNRYLECEYLAESCLPVAADNGMLLLYLYEQALRYKKHAKILSFIQNRLFLMDELNIHNKWNVYKSLVQYYYDSMEMPKLDELLQELKKNYSDCLNDASIFEISVSRKMLDGLDTYLEKYGHEQIRLKKLSRYLDLYLEEHKGEKLPCFYLKAAIYVIRKGKSTKALLEAMQNEYIGKTDNLCLIWEKATRYKVESIDLEEQVVSQFLFTQTQCKGLVPIFESYYRRKNRNQMVIKAFLSYIGYRFILNEEKPEQEIVNIMQEYTKTTDNKFVLLSLLKSYSMEDKLTEEKLKFVDIHIRSFIREKVVLPFFLTFKNQITLPFELANKYYVSYVAAPQSEVSIHYTLENKSGSEKIIREEPMRNVFYGIFVKEFILFHNNKLDFYFMIREKEKSVITENNMIIFQDDLSGDESEYSMLNSLLVAHDMQDCKAVLDMVNQYLEAGYMIKNKFRRLD